MSVTVAPKNLSRERQGMWANSNFSDLVEYNDGFKTGLIGTSEQVSERIRQYCRIDKLPQDTVW
jgi:hypothetical protein